ncbi:hypothetical protein [Sphingomonas sp. RB1R13]|uniref:hypothetical protein n=1 Tax=Sphingomonas sp. RB1R13 TaxID=3096159 RepID=UPI002FC76AA6
MGRPPIFPPGFTWERKPFKKCERCGEIALGLLSAGRDLMTERCAKCRYEIGWVLPKLDKRVIYLDQNAFSVIFKARSGGRLPKGHEDFSKALHEKVCRAVLLQQAVFPHSDLHSEETIVFGQDAGNLRASYEFIGGDIAFVRTVDVELSQIIEFATAYRDRRDPVLSDCSDEVLSSPRNDWLPDMHIRVNADYGAYAGGIRHRREANHEEMEVVYERWQRDKPSFAEILERELSLYGDAKCKGYLVKLQRAFDAMDGGDPEAIIGTHLDSIFDEKRALMEVFKLDPDDEIGAMETIFEFWRWDRNRDMPVHRIASHLWAGLGRRFALGQKATTRGVYNDIKAISTYGPYVDAMFIDKEFANILSETKELRKLGLKARIFSFADGDDFIAYLDELANGASEDVREYAERIYRVK